MNSNESTQAGQDWRTMRPMDFDAALPLTLFDVPATAKRAKKHVQAAPADDLFTLFDEAGQ
ncbi:MAG TPA: hypothetical protein VGH54_28280 [Mycobacterium sp.]|jgi:hypothetical protein|uniref:hypothetical protein n=1 Tax=Mycobacterium sp. TaxID=1785 RepID=UPI002F40B065